jgi:tetratricopeptide (TPR) repeat protein
MAEKLEIQSRFNAIVNQQVIAVGADAHVEQLRRTLVQLNFVQMKVAKTVQTVDVNAQFLIVAIDFSNMPAVQALARFVSGVVGFSGAMVVYVTAPLALTEQDLLFGVELGIKRMFFGPTRDEDIRGFIKQYALEVTENGSMAFVESEVMKAVQLGNEEGLKLQCKKMSQMDKASEDVNRLQVILYEARADYKRMEFHLQQTLKINPQNLWAANQLGRFYLRNRRVAEGIEILKKLSRFHELNSERMLILGDAYLNVGRGLEAGEVLEKGRQMTGGEDERFMDGLAKVDLLNGDMQSALLKLGKKHLSAPVLAFLNTRAVMASRANMLEEGIKLYKEAVAGCNPDDKVILAKLWFNLGLAFVRSDLIDEAIDALSQSVRIGGLAYDRATKTLASARLLKARKGSQLKPSADLSGDDVEFEDFK